MPGRIEHPTPEQLEKRRQATRAAQRYRQRKLAQANAHATHCQRRQGAGRCGGLLEVFTDPKTTRLVVTCPRCVRRERGICLDCPRPVEGKRGLAIRCRACKITARAADTARYTARNRDTVRYKMRERVRMLDPERRRKRLQYKKLWRRANPEKVAAYKARERETRHAQMLAYHAKRREARRAELAAQARAHYYATRKPPTILPCKVCGGMIAWAPPGRPKKTCDACVPPSVRARRRPVVEHYERPTVERPLRTCVTPGCDIVVTHRAKKCPKCKAKHAFTSRLLIASAARAA